MKQKLQNSVGELSFTYKRTLNNEVKEHIHSSRMAYEYFMKYWTQDIAVREKFLVAYLNKKNRVLGHFVVSTGGVSETTVDTKLVLGMGLLVGSSSLVLCHNHPSGSTLPSMADRTVTKRLMNASNLVDMKVLDHLIITEDQYYSFGDEGQL